MPNGFRLPVLLLALAAAFPALAATPVTVAALPPDVTAKAGAAVPFDEYEAESANTNGTIIGPDRRFTTLAAEASGRRAVRLDGTERYAEFVLARPANAITVRYALPDSADGRGIDSSLVVRADGERIGVLPTTSRYGWFYGDYPFTNRPADGRPHHAFDDVRLLLLRTLPAGTRVRLETTGAGGAAWTIIDLADFEVVAPPLSRPAGALSVIDFGADPRGVVDALPAFQRGVAAARRRHATLWIPPGRFRLNGHLIVDRVTIAGAGPWYSVLGGHGVGVYGREAPHPSRGVVLRDFAIVGEVTERVDTLQLAGIGGAMGGGTEISGLFIQHEKVGLWFDGPMDGIRVANLRILDTTADGLNFHRGVSHAVVENCFIRNVGDDGLAAWSGKDADHDVAFRHNTIVSPILANGIAIYGGHDIEVDGNLVADTLTEGGGLHLGNRFRAVPAAGTIRFTNNIVVRGGSFDPHWRIGVGALWFYALDASIAARVEVVGTRLLDSSGPAVQFVGKPVSGVRLDGLTIAGAAGPAIELRSAGAATLANSTAKDVGSPAVATCASGFALRDDGGNHGFGAPLAGACAAVP